MGEDTVYFFRFVLIHIIIIIILKTKLCIFVRLFYYYFFFWGGGEVEGMGSHPLGTLVKMLTLLMKWFLTYLTDGCKASGKVPYIMTSCLYLVALQSKTKQNKSNLSIRNINTKQYLNELAVENCLPT